MKPRTLLRTAAILTLVHSLLHTIGGVFGKPVSTSAAAVAEAMHATRFIVFGVTRSYGDFYVGMGFCVSIFLAFWAVLLWQLGDLMQEQGSRMRPVLLGSTLMYLLLAIDSYRYFFLAPVLFELLIAACILTAVMLKSPVSTTGNNSVIAVD